MLIRTIFTISVLLLHTLFAHAATLTIDNNIITGASGVNFNGILYNITLDDGTCESLFNGCDQAADFPFATITETEARAALTVFLDLIVTTTIAQSPPIFRGCDPTTVCSLITPVSFDNLNRPYFFTITFTNQPYVFDSPLFLHPSLIDTTSILSATYARWTPQQNNNIPEPNALMLLGIGLLSQRWLRTRGKRVPV